MNTTQSAWMLTTQAADYLEMHPDTLRTLYRRGEIKAIKAGKPWRTKQEWLDAYLLNASA